LSGSLDLAALIALVPDVMTRLDLFRPGALGGRVDLSGRATFTPAEGLRVPELTLRAADLGLARLPPTPPI
jgi:hypothetical protein